MFNMYEISLAFISVFTYLHRRISLDGLQTSNVLHMHYHKYLEVFSPKMIVQISGRKIYIYNFCL